MYLVDSKLLSMMKTNKGLTVNAISQSRPVLLVFLRHFGCQFCREAMDELSKQRPNLIKSGTELIFVHMAEPDIADVYFNKFNLKGVQHISDPTCHFYSAFGLVKGTFTQLFGLQTWIRGYKASAKYGNEMGKQLGDSFQMPGAFTIFDSEVRNSFIHKTAADRPDYMDLMRCCAIL
jgi:peroxiredoxin